MSRVRLVHASSAVALWLAAFVATALVRQSDAPIGALTSSGSLFLRWIGVLSLILEIAGVAWIARAGAERIPRRHVQLLIVAATAPMWLLVVALGGARSPAVLLLVAPVVALSSLRAPGAGAALGITTTAALVAADLSLARDIAWPEAALMTAAVTAFATAPAWYARRMGLAAREARQRLARVEGYLADRRHTPRSTLATSSDLRPEALRIQTTAEGMQHLDELDRYLRDIRDTMGADEVVLWRWNESRGTQIPVSWSTEGVVVPAYFDWREWAPLVKWSAEAGMIQCIERDEVPFFVAAPVQSRSRLVGVISVSSGAGLTMARNGARDWLARYADHAALLVDLLEMRRDHRKDIRQTRALLHAARSIQENKSLESLGRAICETALEVTAGKRSALIRWDERRGTGIVECVSAGHPVQPRTDVTSESFLAVQCRLGEPVLKDDSRLLTRRGPLYGPDEPKREVRTLAIVPLKRQHGVVGALVVEGERMEDITSPDLKNLGLLAAVAATSLDNAWELEQTDRRARTDQLTGLYNRRHFDEALSGALSDSARYGHPVSLIVADIDYFKRVNDSHGHQAGDVVLQRVAQVFRDAVRTNDVCARFGGEEIAVLLPHTSTEGARELAERLRQTVADRCIEHQGRSLAITASFGIAGFPESARSLDALFPAADRALYRAKADGRNCVRCAPVSA